MKITTWNVNGIRAALRKGITEWLEIEKPDILCLQETRAFPDQLAPQDREMLGYQNVWNPAQKAGYSGVATYFWNTPQDISLGLGDPCFDSEGRVICTRHPDFYLYNVYFPNGQRGKERVQYKLDFYQLLLEHCTELHNKGQQIIITGDFNTAHQPIDLKNPEENQNTSGFLPEERDQIDQYLSHGFVDIYRDLYPEREQYTWWTYRFNARRRNIGWRIDYFLLSKTLADQVQDVIIHDQVMGSDHCPVTLEIS